MTASSTLKVSLLLLATLCASACSGSKQTNTESATNPSAEAPSVTGSETTPASTTTPSTPPTTTTSSTTTFAITDCKAAAAPFGDLLQGMTPFETPSTPGTGEKIVLHCGWMDTAGGVASRNRTVMLTAGLSKVSMYNDELINALKMHRVAAPALEAHGGLAFAGSSKNTDNKDNKTGGQFQAQLPDASILLLTSYGADVPADQQLDDARSVEVVNHLLGY